MGLYQFRGTSPEGKSVEGRLDASTRQEAMAKLKGEGFEVESLVDAKSEHTKKVGKVGIKHMQIFTRQMATMISSGVHISQSLELMSEGALNTNLKQCLSEINQHVAQGAGLADAMSKYPQIFDRLFLSMVKAGEEAGVLETIFDRLAKYIESTAKLRSKVKAAMWYPAVIMVIAILVILAIFIFVIPQFKSLFSSSGQELPQLTQIVIAASEFSLNYWYIIIAFVVATGVALKKTYDTEAGKKLFDRYVLKVPVFGNLVRISSVARFSRTLSTLVSSGVPIVDALNISANVIGNNVIEAVVHQSKDAVTKGRTLSSCFMQSKEIPQMVSHMIVVGEQTGNVDGMLNKVADFYEDEVDNAVGGITSIIEPILMVTIGGIIAVLVIAMYLPIFNLGNVLGV